MLRVPSALTVKSAKVAWLSSVVDMVVTPLVVVAMENKSLVSVLSVIVNVEAFRFIKSV